MENKTKKKENAITSPKPKAKKETTPATPAVVLAEPQKTTKAKPAKKEAASQAAPAENKKTANKKAESSAVKKDEVKKEKEVRELNNTLLAEASLPEEYETIVGQNGKKVKIKKPRIISKEELGLVKPEKKKFKFKKKKVKTLDDVERITADPKKGLTAEQVISQTEKKLTNKTNVKNAKSYKAIFFGNIFTFFNLLCLTVAGALIAVQSYKDVIFMVIFLANIAVAIITEIKAKKTVEKINLVTAPTATVLRDGVAQDITVSEVVLDDIMLFSLGKQISADCIVLEGEVEVNESLLTGESVPVKKKKGDVLFAGSFIASGKCKARVNKIGEFNYSASLTAKAKEMKGNKSELLRSMRLIIRAIGIIIIPLSVLMFLNNWDNLVGDLPEVVKSTAGSMIGMIPAGMFLLTSVALAVGVVKLYKKRTSVQDLYSIEMLARVDVLCLDKTGTITDGTMKVNSVLTLAKDHEDNLNSIMGSMLTALDDNNQTSRAMATYFGYSKDFISKTIMPFSSARKLSAVTFKNGSTYAIGAPEFVLKEKNAEIDKLVEQYASKGMRVLLLAKFDGEIEKDKLPVRKRAVALIIIEDQIRHDAAETLQWFKENGVAVKIISGDNPITVSEVSKRVGVENADKYVSLEGLSEQQVIEYAHKYTVFGRVSPEQKCVLVKALKNRGHKVAMTGDGVNDILALKEADCSIAMASGSEAARNASSLVLLDSNFASMPSVVAEGRRVVNNIQKSSALFLMKTFFTIFFTIFCLIMRETYPLTPSFLLILELCVIGAPSTFLSLQPNKEKIHGKFLANLITGALPGAIIFTLSIIACFFYDRIVGTNGQFETMASLILVFSGLLLLFKLCKPMNVYRACVYAAMVTIVILILVFVPFGFFGYVNLELQNVLVITVIVQLTYPLYANVVNLVNLIRFPDIE